MITRTTIPRDRLAAGSALMIGLCWLWAGFVKMFDLGGFGEAIRVHGVLPVRLVELAPAFPFVEVVLGFLVLALPSRNRGAVLVLLVSGGAVIALTVYLLAVPDEALARVGCACSMRRDPVPTQSRAFPLARNLGLLGVHAIALAASRVRTGSGGPGRPSR